MFYGAFKTNIGIELDTMCSESYVIKKPPWPLEGAGHLNTAQLREPCMPRTPLWLGPYCLSCELKWFLCISLGLCLRVFPHVSEKCHRHFKKKKKGGKKVQKPHWQRGPQSPSEINLFPFWGSWGGGACWHKTAACWISTAKLTCRRKNTQGETHIFFYPYREKQNLDLFSVNLVSWICLKP